MAEMQNVAKVPELPWMTMPGNHEADCHDPACFAKKEYRDVSPEAPRFLFPSLSLSFGVLLVIHSSNPLYHLCVF